MSDGSKIERLIESDNWSEARRVIRSELRSAPESHWLLSRLALTYYEQFRYSDALKYELQALELAPHCPLVLWGLAGTYQALERHDQALQIYRRIVRRGVDRIAKDPCGEGRGRARGLVADCYYRMSASLKSLGHARASSNAFDKHLDMRGPGCFSIYRLDELRV